MQAPTRLTRAQRDLRHRLAENARAARARLGLTQEKAAERAGYSLQYFQRIEREIVNVPLDTVARLAQAFQVDPSQLVAKTRPRANAQPG